MFNDYISVRLILILAGLILVGGAQAETITLVDQKTRETSFVCGADLQTQRIAGYLSHYLRQRQPKLRVRMASRYEADAEGPQFVLATARTARSLGLPDEPAQFDEKDRPDAYLLEVKQAERGPRVLLIGKTEAGLRQAIYRLIQKLINDGQSLQIETGRERHSPFIRTRLICLAPTGRRQIPDHSPLADANIETWEARRLEDYPEVFAQFGFSGIQVTEIAGYGSIRGEKLQQARDTVAALARGAKRLGMFVSLDQWGDCPWVEGEALCWEVEQERAELVKSFEGLAERYGPYVDHVYIHVGDPGGATHGGCDWYVTPQKITAAVREMFRAYNPQVSATMSTWANTHFWKYCPHPVDLGNYEPVFTAATKDMSFDQPIPDGAKFLDATWMPSDIGIALHRVYNSDQADELVAAGRPVDVWGWYTGDMEMMVTLTVNVTTVDEFYRDLPDEAGERIRWQTIELCYHGWPQIINSYVGAQKMWNPRRPVEEIVREFCVAGFGPNNAQAVAELYRICEIGWDYDVWMKPYEYVPMRTQLGDPQANKRMRQALEAAEAIRFPDGWQPNFAFPVPVEKYVEMLTARVRLTLALSEARLAVDEARQGGADDEEIQAIKQQAVESLPRLPIDPMYRQDETTIIMPFKVQTWAELVMGL